MPGVKGRSGGHNAKTRAQLKQQGTFRGDRHAGYENPDPPKGRPEPPKPLDGDALEEWGRTVDRLEQSQTLSVVDDAVIYQYCCLFADTEQIAVRQVELGSTIQTMEENIGDLKGDERVAMFQEIGKLRKLESQYVSQARSGRMGLRMFLAEMGLTPAARGRVRVKEAKSDADKPKSPLAALQDRARKLRAV